MKKPTRISSPAVVWMTWLFLSLADAAVANAHAAVSVGFESNQIWVSETNQQVTLNVLRSGDAS
ncbi:MAG: hypothetical protein HY043_21680, partial [Verrucomicrobia bacterium]|nr:hypothetical protein [Verrucomicrobiota bacterium]